MPRLLALLQALLYVHGAYGPHAPPDPAGHNVVTQYAFNNHNCTVSSSSFCTISTSGAITTSVSGVRHVGPCWLRASDVQVG